MTDKIIAIEETEGPFQKIFQNLLQLVPKKDVGDKKLQRLIAFRLKLDGEDLTRQYLSRKIEEAIQCAYSGSLYDFLKDDFEEKQCATGDKPPEPPEVA